MTRCDWTCSVVYKCMHTRMKNLEPDDFIDFIWHILPFAMSEDLATRWCFFAAATPKIRDEIVSGGWGKNRKNAAKIICWSTRVLYALVKSIVFFSPFTTPNLMLYFNRCIPLHIHTRIPSTPFKMNECYNDKSSNDLGWIVAIVQILFPRSS